MNIRARSIEFLLNQNQKLMVTITISGFKNKAQAKKWLEAYENSGEQSMSDCLDDLAPAIVEMDSYIKEMKAFKNDKDKNNFDLKLES